MAVKRSVHGATMQALGWALGEGEWRDCACVVGLVMFGGSPVTLIAPGVVS